ncbi:MAG: biotin--[acetyl-CoA-carboxylase] ligase [Candidatus Rokubacteria bacterium]|nr:biotin--[acetyl-CoA-carboxylase] ligase [Candidatus Rokubacteria bacterium]
MSAGDRARPRLGHVVHEHAEVESTQLELARLAAAGAPEGTAVTAVHQRAGRGRQGRSWWDEAGASLLLSVLLRPPLPVSGAPVLSLMAGVAVAEALEEVAGVRAGLRWPNDILVDGAKVSGILAEAVSTGDGCLRYVILGIGVNLNQTGFPPALAGAATSLHLVTGAACDPARVREAILGALDRRYREFLGDGFEPSRVAWRRRSVSLGRPVTGAGRPAGTAVDIDGTGALVVQQDDGSQVRVWWVAPAGQGVEAESDAPRH